jgi:hypothetical protein
MVRVLVVAGTLWTLWTAFLVLPLLRAPFFVLQGVVALLSAELLTLLVWSYGSEGCVARPCSVLAETARTAALVDIPLLTAALMTLTVVHALRRMGLRKAE